MGMDSQEHPGTQGYRDIFPACRELERSRQRTWGSFHPTQGRGMSAACWSQAEFTSARGPLHWAPMDTAQQWHCRSSLLLSTRSEVTWLRNYHQVLLRHSHFQTSICIRISLGTCPGPTPTVYGVRTENLFPTW